MVSGGHRHASHLRPAASVPGLSSLTQLDVLVVGVADLAHGGLTFHQHTPYLA
jgi:hypothetical protein